MEVIKTDKLTKYYGKARGIIHVDLNISQGEFFGFIGPNGAGKSTTIRILLGLITPTGGSAFVLGKDIGKEKEVILKDTGYVPAEASFYKGMKVRRSSSFRLICAKQIAKPRRSSCAGACSSTPSEKSTTCLMATKRKWRSYALCSIGRNCSSSMSRPAVWIRSCRRNFSTSCAKGTRKGPPSFFPATFFRKFRTTARAQPSSATERSLRAAAWTSFPEPMSNASAFRERPIWARFRESEIKKKQKEEPASCTAAAQSACSKHWLPATSKM